MDRKHNNSLVMIELDRELAEFLIKNCEYNTALGLSYLQSGGREDIAHRIVDILEKFKEIKKKTEAAL